jgi:signal transduction histidine kinase
MIEYSNIALALAAFAVVATLFYWLGKRKGSQAVKPATADAPADLVPWSKVNELIEHDRRRISSDLHDELGTILHLIHFDLELAMRDAEVIPPHIEAKLLTMKKNLTLTITTIRSIIWNLSPDFLEGMTLTFALRELCHKLDGLKGTHVHFVQSGSPVTLSQRQKLNLFRMVQELFTNAIKHSNAWNISVHLHWDADGMMITVSDDGSEYRRKEFEQKSLGMGSINLVKRANSIGATLTYKDKEGEGRGIHSVIEMKFAQNQHLEKEQAMF